MSYGSKQDYLLTQRRRSLLKKCRSSWIPYAIIFFLSFTLTCNDLMTQHDKYIALITSSPESMSIVPRSFSGWIKYELGYDRLIINYFPNIAILMLIYWGAMSVFIAFLQGRIEHYHILNNNESTIVSPQTTDDPKVLELKLKQVRTWRKSWLVYVTILLISTSLIYKVGNNGWYPSYLQNCFQDSETYSFISFLIEFIPDVSLLAIPICSVYALILYLIETNIHTRLTKLANVIVAMENEIRIQQVSEDIYKHSIKMSYEYLNQYYEQTRKQAENGFRITMNVAIGGGIIIALGILAMFLDQMEPAYITTATGVIIEFIASIFFYLYNRTMQNMGDYHNKLVLSQNIAIALEVVKDIEGEEQNNVKSHMVKELIRDINTHINENKPERKSDSVEHPKPQPAENDS